MPRLSRFEAQNPGIDLRIETSTELVDFQRSEVHAAIRLGHGSYPGLYSEKLMDEWLVPVCQPTMFAKLGPVNGHADLKRYRLLHSSSEPWSIWLLGAPHNNVTSRISIDDSTAIVRAAEAGGGLALTRWSLVADGIGSGRLALAGRHITQHPLGYYFVCPPKHHEMPKVAAFHDWLRVEAAKHGPPGGKTRGQSPPTAAPT